MKIKRIQNTKIKIKPSAKSWVELERLLNMQRKLDIHIYTNNEDMKILLEKVHPNMFVELK